MPKTRVFKVEDLRAKRTVKDGVQYLVKWEGYPETANSWVDEVDVGKQCIDEYNEVKTRKWQYEEGSQWLDMAAVNSDEVEKAFQAFLERGSPTSLTIESRKHGGRKVYRFRVDFKESGLATETSLTPPASHVRTLRRVPANSHAATAATAPPCSVSKCVSV